MDRDLREVVARHGYMMVHKTLQDLMRQDYEYLKSLFEPEPVNSVHTVTIEKEAPTQKGKRGRKPKGSKPETSPQAAREDLPLFVSEPEVKTITIQPEQEDQLLSLSNFIPQVTEPGETAPPRFQDSKEQKVWQKEMEVKKKAENDAAGITFSQVLTKENLKQWIEVEGKTYAWVAREKAGCPDAQVAATAQMMGIKSKISKKRGILMSRH
jgi:hypothetical protein